MGRATVAGGNPMMDIPSPGLFAKDLAVGSVVKLVENGSPVEYIVVNQGRPSSMYDSSCDGTWLLRKDVYSKYRWDNDDVGYNTSDIKSYVDSTFRSKLGTTELNTIKTVKIPYCLKREVYSGSSGVSVRAFLLSVHELGCKNSLPSTDNYYMPVEGAVLEYFSGATNEKRIANYNGDACYYWARTSVNASMSACYINMAGQDSCSDKGVSNGVRPAVIVPYEALFDEDTLVLKGVA